jgi:hypothetical protein
MSESELDARRLADALEALEAGHDPGVDPREDPQLSSLLETASIMSSASLASTDTPSFRSYRERSKGYLLHRLRRQQTMAHKPPSAPQRQWITRLFDSWRPAIVLSGAAAAVMVGAVLLSNPLGNTSDGTPTMVSAPPASGVPVSESNTPVISTKPSVDAPAVTPTQNTPTSVTPTQNTPTSVTPTQSTQVSDAPVPETTFDSVILGSPLAPNLAEFQRRSIVQQIGLISRTLNEISMRTARGELVDIALLRTVTESTASVANLIQSAPDGVITVGELMAYLEMAGSGQNILSQAQTADDNGGALHAARLATQDAIVVAARHIMFTTE